MSLDTLAKLLAVPKVTVFFANHHEDGQIVSFDDLYIELKDANGDSSLIPHKNIVVIRVSSKE